jgi:DNA-damage-inducible protein J
MKDSVVRARIDSNLKSQASKVLAECGLEPSDAIRMFLRQVVVQGGIPFTVHSGGDVRAVDPEILWAMKRAAQARDHAIASREDLSAGEMLLIRPDQVRGAKVKWPSARLID